MRGMGSMSATIGHRLSAAEACLLALREQVCTTIDAALRDVRDLVTQIQDSEAKSALTAEEQAAAHLCAHGAHGELVRAIAERHGVALHLVLGPGHARTGKALAARREAACALRGIPLGLIPASRVLRVSDMTIRVLTRKKA